MQDFTFDVNDILNENLMPASLMLIEERDNADWKNLSSQKLDNDFQCATRDKIKEDGKMSTALDSMSYHRRMINEFLCSRHVAEKILEEIHPTQMMRKRLGLAQISSPEIEFERNNSLLYDDVTGSGSRQRMLFDEGSYQYKNWLAK